MIAAMSASKDPEAAALAALRTLKGSGHRAYFVGGCVRDRLRGRTPSDYDLATSATPDEVLRLFPGADPRGAAYGVVLVRMAGIDVEIATFRRDLGYLDGRRPTGVVFTTLEEDARRRDFTINALYEDPDSGEIVDPAGGLADLRANVLRTIGDATQRFREDRLRLLRAARFAADHDLTIAPDTRAALVAEAPALAEVSGERQRVELVKLLQSGRGEAGIHLLRDLALLPAILPEIAALSGVDQPPEFHPEGDVFIHTAMLFRFVNRPSPTLAIGALLHDIGKPRTMTRPDPGQGGRIRFNGHAEVGAEMADAVCHRLQLDATGTRAIVELVAKHMHFKDLMQARESTLRRFLRLPRIDEHLAMHRLDCLAAHGDLTIHAFCTERLAALGSEKLRPARLLTGTDLKALGYPKGPLYKEILAALEDAQLEDRLATRDDALRFVAEHWPR